MWAVFFFLNITEAYNICLLLPCWTCCQSNSWFYERESVSLSLSHNISMLIIKHFPVILTCTVEALRMCSLLIDIMPRFRKPTEWSYPALRVSFPLSCSKPWFFLYIQTILRLNYHFNVVHLPGLSTTTANLGVKIGTKCIWAKHSGPHNVLIISNHSLMLYLNLFSRSVRL